MDVPVTIRRGNHHGKQRHSDAPKQNRYILQWLHEQIQEDNITIKYVNLQMP